MSKRAEQAALGAYPPTRTEGKRHAKRVQSESVDTHKSVRTIFQKGYETAEKDLIALVKQYLAKGERCMEQEGESQTYAFWDGFHNCSENILRELDEE